MDFEVPLRAIGDEAYDVGEVDPDDLGRRSTRGVLEYLARVG